MLWVVNNYISPDFFGAGSDTKSENPPKKIVLSELQPVSSNRIHPWVFPLRWFWIINCLFLLALFCFVCFLCLFVTSLWEQEGTGWEVQQCHRRLWDGARGNGPFNRFFFSDIQQNVCSPSTKCENDDCITKTFSQRGWAVIWNKLIFSWEGSKSLEVLFF